jgi:hypothetical protein
MAYCVKDGKKFERVAWHWFYGAKTQAVYGLLC